MTRYFPMLPILILSAVPAFAFGSRQAAAPKSDTAIMSAAAPVPADAIWVSRPDGAESCAPKSGQSLDDGSSALKQNHIEVLSSRKGSDGMMHMQMCGAAKGSTNAYLIKRGDLAKALSLGYLEAKK